MEGAECCAYANEIACLFQDSNLMSNASQRDSTSEAGSATTYNNKMNLERCLLCGFMTTRLDLRRAPLIQDHWTKVRRSIQGGE